MSRLSFLSPDECGPEVALVSPLRNAELGEAVRDVSALGKLEVRGETSALEPAEGEQVLPLGPGRALVVTDGPARAARKRLAGQGYRVYDQTAALAAFELEGDDLLRRLTELDPATLPAVGAVARGVGAVIEPRGGERYRLFVPQELGHYVAEVAADAARGLGR